MNFSRRDFGRLLPSLLVQAAPPSHVVNIGRGDV